MAEPVAIRAALLARPGEACERLAAALRDAGADVVLVGDPRSLDPAVLREAAPQAVLVALEPAVEDSLERFDTVLHDPAVMVVFDEADLAARREGWDAARWGRHLRAKLQGHDDVLPPGAAAASAATDVGDVTDRGMDDGGMDDGVDAGGMATMASFDEPPRDAGGDTTVRLDDTPLELEWTADGAADDASPLTGGVILVGADDLLDPVDDAGRDGAVPVITIDSTPLELDWSADRDVGDPDDGIVIGRLELVDGDALVDSIADPDASPVVGTVALDPDVQAMLDSLPDADIDNDVDTSPRSDARSLDADVLAMRGDTAAQDIGLDAADIEIDGEAGAPMAASPHAAPRLFDFDGMSLDEMDDGDRAGTTAGDDGSADAPAATPVERAAPDFSRFDIGLSLADEDAAPPAAVAIAADAPGASRSVDLDALDARASALSLVEVPVDGAHDPAAAAILHGAVVIDAGLGGPDAVRQLLGGLPADFPRALLVRLALDGGRYDRLVKQMERASALRVSIAEAGAAVMAGTVYFLPDDVGLARRADGFAFVAGDAAGADLLDDLPAADSALLLLSGSDAGRVDRALQMAADGALVAGQSPQDCYDSRASGALIAGGAASGTPVELAARLVARWPA